MPCFLSVSFIGGSFLSQPRSFRSRRLESPLNFQQRPGLPLGLAEVLITPHSPWQNPFAERVIGTIRRELLDHVIVLNERHLRRRLRNYLGYYHASRTHLALGKDAPEPRSCRANRARRYRGSASSRRPPPPLHPLRCVATVVQLSSRS